jgi:glycosyltransferase involved in cell wall biosynthesis
MAKKLFFDISGLLIHLNHSKNYTGIQRTLTTVIEKSRNRFDEKKIYLSFYNKKSQKYECFCIEDIPNEIILNPERFKNCVLRLISGGNYFPPLNIYSGDVIKSFYHHVRFLIIALSGNENFFHKRCVSRVSFRQYIKAKIRDSIFGKSYNALFVKDFHEVAKGGDALCILDSSWVDSHVADNAKLAKDFGVNVHVFVHDLIPIVQPNFCTGDNIVKFGEWLNMSTIFATDYIVNSEATKSDLKVFLEKNHIKKSIHTITLAQEFSMHSRSSNSLIDFKHISSIYNLRLYPEAAELVGLDDDLRLILTEPFVLCVGTLEPRKNVLGVLLAWQLLLKDNDLEKVPRIVFCGKAGWLNNDFEMLMKSTSDLGGRAKVISEPTDAVLQVLYKRCSFFVFPSFYEGWGLPVGEALALGKTGVISNTSSLPEVGKDLVIYCDPKSPKSIMEGCKRFLTEEGLCADFEKKIRNRYLRTWSDVAEDLLDYMVHGRYSQRKASSDITVSSMMKEPVK